MYSIMIPEVDDTKIVTSKWNRMARLHAWRLEFPWELRCDTTAVYAFGCVGCLWMGFGREGIALAGS